jgi:hypothetical protein
MTQWLQDIPVIWTVAISLSLYRIYLAGLL